MKPEKRCGACDLPGRTYSTVSDKGKPYELKICKACRNLKQRGDRHNVRATIPEVPITVIPNLFETQLKRILFVPDAHHPFVDKQAWDVMLRAGTMLQPDIIVVEGDFGDFYSCSAHDKNPTRTNDLEYEVGKIREARAQLDKLGASKKIFIEGNHEFRLARYLASNAPAVFKMLSVPELFELTENGWDFVPYKASCRLGKLHLTHDTGTAGQNAHRQSMNAFQGSCVIGHTHRMEFSVTGNADGPPQVGAMFGWLGSFEEIDYMHAIAAKRAWVHGFGIGFMEPSGVVHLQPVPIVNGACCVLGQIIR